MIHPARWQAAGGYHVATKTETALAAGPLGFEAKLWEMADALRNNMDAAE
jgi:hypothetical protein